ncbi:DUF4145 domain-containing protein [Serratia symbiotica]|nr:DUF4145 domain-containing protein [Serratia symbiotica]CDS57585.1 conserved hypothetical protein [Serratia symbiotica]
MMNKINKRFEELLNQAKEIKDSEYETYIEGTGPYKHVDSEKLLNWLTKTENLIVNICGENSIYYSRFIENKNAKAHETNLILFNRINAIFSALKDDYEDGYMTSYKSLIQAEVFDNELEQAKELLNSGYILAAAVIAGTVLETSLRELCDRESLAHGKLDKMNVDLAKAGTYNTIQQKKITAIAGIRNSAAHGKTDDFNKNEVSTMINDIEYFLIQYLK